MQARTFLASLLALAPGSTAFGQGSVPYATQADWESYPGGVTTGGAFADINGDGHLDMVVANGNDILRQHVEVYLNDGLGNFPANPQWQSGDIDYHGHLAVGDVDQDGWTDVAVSVFLGAGGFSSPGHAKLYRNLGGTLESQPSWRSTDTFYSFSCDLGDADGDGDLDLAVATGEPYFHGPDRNRIYYNQGGALSTTPGWLSGASDHTLDVTFGDVDADGDLDVAFCTAQGPNRIFFQAAGAISTSAGWTSTDNNSQNGNSIVFWDTDGDGYLELAVSDNFQLSGGTGDFKVYDNSGGSLATAPAWTGFGGYCSAVAFGDVHLDGFPDLAVGLWWGGTRVHLNDAGVLSTVSNWQSSKTSVVEALFFGDVDGKGLRGSGVEIHPGTARLYYLDHAPVHSLQQVWVDGVAVGPGAYSADLESGWIALSAAPAQGIGVQYTWSESLDLGVTNWDTSIGNLLFLREDLVPVTATATSGTSLQEGDTLSLDATVRSTTNRTESFLLAVVAVPPAAPQRILTLENETLAPFGQKTKPYSYVVPMNLPPSFLGSYTLTVAVVAQGAILGQDSFPFTIS